MKKLPVIALLLLTLCAPAFARDENNIPKESYEKLGRVFTRVTKNLWGSIDRYWHQGQYERDIAILRTITVINPYSTQAYDDGAWLMRNQLRDEEAEAFLLQGLSANPDIPDLYSAMGIFYYEHERPVESVLCYEHAVDLGASDIISHRLAHSYEEAGYFYEAANIWLGLQYTEPDSPVPQIQLRRMLAGGAPPNTPSFMSRAREARKKAAAEKKKQ